MKQFHTVEVSLFLKEEEDVETWIQSLKLMFPFELDKQLEIKSMQGFNEKSIIDVHVTLTKQPEIKGFLKNVFDNISKDQIRLLDTQLKSRLDKQGNFFFRIATSSIDRPYTVTEHGDCIHVKVKVAAFPATEEHVMAVMRQFFQTLIQG